MNRRNFFKRVGMCAAAMAIAPQVIEAIGVPPTTKTFAHSLGSPAAEAQVHSAVISQYADYVSWSGFTSTEYFSPEILELSEQLAKRSVRSINRLACAKRHVRTTRSGIKIFRYDLSPPYQEDLSPAHRISSAYT